MKRSWLDWLVTEKLISILSITLEKRNALKVIASCLSKQVPVPVGKKVGKIWTK